MTQILLTVEAMLVALEAGIAVYAGDLGITAGIHAAIAIVTSVVQAGVAVWLAQTSAATQRLIGLRRR